MFRKDRLTVKRKKYIKVNGETNYLEPEIIAENVPCHLSVSLNNTAFLNGTPYVYSNFMLFLNPDIDFFIKENDILYVKTSKKQEYKLIAGEIKIYDLTIQVKCKQEKIIESKK